MGQSVLVDYQHSLHGPPHSNLLKLLPHPLEPGCHGAVLLVQRLLRAERVVRQGVSTPNRNKVELETQTDSLPQQLLMPTGYNLLC